MIWIVSRRRVAGFSNGMPWNSSITSLPLVPSPAMARPPEISSRVVKCCASAAGVREKMLTIEVPSVIREVRSARIASGPNGSRPQASVTKTVSTPASSAAWTYA